MTGTVKYYNKNKGYGFIQGENGTELYFTKTSSASKRIAAGDTVEYETIATSKGVQAFNVKKV